MVLSLLRGMLGPFAVVLDFILANTETVSAVLGLWLALYLAGRIQLSRIEKRLHQMILDESHQEAGVKRSLTPHAIYKRVENEFQEGLPFGMLFIPHRLDLWPVRPTYQHVIEKIPLSQALVESVLKNSGVGSAPKKSTQP